MDQLTSQSIREPVAGPEVTMRTWVVAEVIGTFTLVSVAGAAVLSRYPLPALGLAVVLMMLIYAVGHFTGGHLNAAVTLAVLTRRRIGLRAAVVHWLAQFGGGMLAAVMVREIIDPARVIVAAELTVSDRTLIAVFVAELTFAFALTYAVLGFATSAEPAPGSASDLAVGGGVLVGAIGLAALSTGALHAATALHYLAAGVFTWPTVWVFLVGQTLSGFFAGIAFLTFGWWAYYEE
ncbi:aquaporin [Mycolicibacterium tusciae]|uniref:aquaporin n=1 Tax=Mycolicibacterium tusciae TaxID=75922 RepID=UPI0006857B21|nr:aquaporin [Mycolicibacterium tusciae]